MSAVHSLTLFFMMTTAERLTKSVPRGRPYPLRNNCNEPILAATACSQIIRYWQQKFENYLLLMGRKATR